jgi:putative ABC transport system permease protein
MNVITRGVRNAFRNVIRTLSIVTILGLSIGLSLAMLLANQAVGQKIESVKATVGNVVNISPAGVRGFDGGGEALTAESIAKVENLDHVTSVGKSLNDRLDTDNTDLKSAIEAGSLGKRFSQNNGQRVIIRGPGPQDSAQTPGGATTSFTPPITVIGTTAPTKLSSAQGGGTFKLTDGEVFASNSSEKVAIVGSSLATKNNLKVGSTFTAHGEIIKVVGIFDAGNTFSNNQVIMPLKTVQALSEQTDSFTSVTLTVDSVTNVESVTAAAKDALGDTADVTNDVESTKNTIKPLENIKTISLYSLIGSVTAGIIIVLMTMIMIVRERRREIGVLKAIGASNLKVIGQFTTEAITLTSLSAAIGIIIGAIASNPITKMLLNNATSNEGQALENGGRMMMRGPIGDVGRGLQDINAVVGWDIILYGFAAALVIAVIGSAIASFFIAKVRPAEVMRAE